MCKCCTQPKDFTSVSPCLECKNAGCKDLGVVWDRGFDCPKRIVARKGTKFMNQRNTSTLRR